MSEVTEEAVEAAAKALHDHWQSGFRPWAETCERLPGQAKSFRGKARAALEAALPLIVAGERESEREHCAKKAESFKLGEHSMLAGTGSWAVHDGACIEIAAAIRADKGGE